MNSGRLEGVSNDPIPLDANNPHELAERGPTFSGISNIVADSTVDNQTYQSPVNTFTQPPEAKDSKQENLLKPTGPSFSNDLSNRPAPGDQRDFDDLYEKANFHRQAADYVKAIRVYEELVKLDQEFAPAFFERGLCYVELSKDQLAIDESFSDALRLGLEDFARAIAMDVKYWSKFRKEPFYLDLGIRQNAVESYIKRKSDTLANLPKGDAGLSRSITVSIEGEGALDLDSIEVVKGKGWPSGTADHATDGNSELEGSPIERVNNGLRKPATEDIFPDSFEDYEGKVAVSEPDTLADAEFSSLVDPTAYALYKRAQLHQDLGESNSALNDFSAAVILYPGFAAALYARALCYVSLRRDELALEDFSNAIALEPAYWSSLRKEQFYLDLGVRRADVEKYIESRCSAYDNGSRRAEFPGIPQENDSLEVDQYEHRTTSRGLFQWAGSLTRLFQRNRPR